MDTLTVAIVAGGKSSRMGTDKSFASLLGKPMIEHVIERVADLGQSETLIITNRPDDYAYLGLPMYADVIPDSGSLGGIYTAIHSSRCEYTLVVACDMPFVSPKLLRYMISLCDGVCDVIVPRVDGYPEGLHALYRKTCLLPIRRRLEAQQLKVIGFYGEVNVRYLDEPEYAALDPNGMSFQNINTPDELRTAETRMRNE